MKRQRYLRAAGGVSVAETAASLVLLLPLLILIIFVVLEASRAYMIKESLAQGAREAARSLAVIYGQDQTIATGGWDIENARVYSNIHINQTINDGHQFSAVWDTSNSMVTVTCNYLSGQYSLPTFPNPDPLHLAGNFQLSSTSTYRLE